MTWDSIRFQNIHFSYIPGECIGPPNPGELVSNAISESAAPSGMARRPIRDVFRMRLPATHNRRRHGGVSARPHTTEGEISG